MQASRDRTEQAESLARLRLARSEGVGPATFRRLLERHGSARTALAALPRLAAASGRPLAACSEEDALREAEALARMGGRFVHLGDPDYPPLLALIEDAPPVLSVLGDATVLKRPQAGVVGARSASAAGRRVAEELSAGLTMGGIAVTSGLARGIDAAAHLGALNAHGRTIAVVAGGLDEPYPAENAALQARIAAEGGAVVAEAPLGTAPLARHFPRRNRIVAGLVLGLVVVEAAHRSGSLITARLALEAGREVFAVPGSPLDPRSRGSNDLIRQGAHLVETAEDVLAHLPQAPREAPLFRVRSEPEAEPAVSEDPPAPTDASGQLLELIGPTPVAVDDLARRCHLSAPAVRAMLLDLELSGLVEPLPGDRVARSAR
ncbi:DNA-processing protein DprA [Falsiroseomonas sp. HW251]|uniref:DNA-processing protein DprA n=1 Tax=Falsiroseomonas sp. HW251 TaxID=3390998 RepID=UPI003D31E703